MIAEVQVTEMIDRLLNPIAFPNHKNANGFHGERSGATVRSGNIHRFCFELSKVGKKAQKYPQPHGEA
jgi:hypothetical protein